MYGERRTAKIIEKLLTSVPIIYVAAYLPPAPAHTDR